ncbi:sn-glycerol-3-phosphate ABC transporter ATP-binding protein UgpC [bacterium]|nr:sn-glycerol-3-phosphate ABC transporter ATP-binding protein UgpC [bacterium]
MASVELKQVSKLFDNSVKAVDAVDIFIEDKEFVVLVGPSGCGKSTTLRMIAGLEEITSGEIKIGDKVVNQVAPKDRDIAMVFQNYALYPHMTVYENMAFGLKLRKYSKQEIETRVREAAEILSINGLLQRKPKELSGGQRQRVAVGRAIVRKPQVFLFDEPLSNLDAKLRIQMRTEISKLHSRLETTMIYVTHDQVEAMTMGDRIVVMRDGRIQQIDTPLNLYHRPQNQFVAGFIGSPAMNFIDGELIRENGLCFKTAHWTLPVAEGEHLQALAAHIGQPVIMGIRPEDLAAAADAAGASTLTCKVDVVEPMGNETFIYLNTGADTLVARMSLAALPAVFSDFAVQIDMNKAHFFDKKTEQVIR